WPGPRHRRAPVRVQRLGVLTAGGRGARDRLPFVVSTADRSLPNRVLSRELDYRPDPGPRPAPDRLHRDSRSRLGPGHGALVGLAYPADVKADRPRDEITKQ